MISIFYALASFVSWLIALNFIRLKRNAIIFNSVFSAVFCSIIFIFINNTMYEQYFLLIEILIYLFILIIVRIQVKIEYGDMMISFFIAQGIHSIFIFLIRYLLETKNFLIFVFFIFIIIIYLYLTNRLYLYFPQQDWRDYYANSMPEPERMELKIWHVYFVSFLIGVIPTLVLILIHPYLSIEMIVWSIVLSTILWLGILLLCIMNFYKKERISLLLEQQYREEMQVFLNVIRSQRHDYNFHVQTIASLIQEGKIEDCAKYVNALEKDSSILNDVLPLKDPAISSMIHNFQLMAIRLGIILHIDIQNDLSQIATSAYETNKIISNLLQNAIDETRTHEDKSYGICLTITKRGEYCVVRVSNKIEKKRSAEELGLIFKQGYTTKQGHDGVGLSAVKSLALRYKGTIYTQLDGDVLHFVAKIPINYAKIIEN